MPVEIFSTYLTRLTTLYTQGINKVMSENEFYAMLKPKIKRKLSYFVL